MADTDLGIPYPSDYDDPADSPLAMQASALKIDELISGRVLIGRKINTTAPLTGGGDLTTDRTLGITPGTYPPSARKINTVAPLTGGGDLTADRTLSITPGYYARVFVQASQPPAGNIGDIWVPT